MNSIPIDPLIAVVAAILFLITVAVTAFASLMGWQWHVVAFAAVLLVSALAWLGWAVSRS